jgi:hypothetical protein
MIISDLDYQEVVGKENRIEGGVQFSRSSSSAIGLATIGRVSVSSLFPEQLSSLLSFSPYYSSTPIVTRVQEPSSASAYSFASTYG